MKKKENYMLMVHDELFNDLVAPVEQDNKKGKKSKVELTKNSSMFTVHELFLLAILIDYRLKNPEPETPIALSYIHKRYRGKRIGKTRVMSESDLNAYVEALNGLQMKKVNLYIGKTRSKYHLSNKEVRYGRLFTITSISRMENGDYVFTYDLGNYGEILSLSKRYSDMVPIDIIKIPYKQNIKLYIAMYISRLIFINKRMGKKEFTVTTESIMKRIRIHDKDGNDMGTNLYRLMSEKNLSKYSKERLFWSYLLVVLELLKVKGSIYDYSLPEEHGWKCHIVIKK